MVAWLSINYSFRCFKMQGMQQVIFAWEQWQYTMKKFALANE